MATGLSSLMNTARDALRAQSFGVTVTGQNISNVNTPGYARREVMLESRALGHENYGGVQIRGMRQIVELSLEREQLITLSNQSASKHLDRELAVMESRFHDEGGTGLGAQMDQLFQSFGALAARPADEAIRNEILARAEDFASSARGLADNLSESRSKLFASAQAVVNSVNTRAQEIADLNRQIVGAEAQGRDAADLRDRRTQLLLDLAQMVDVKTTIDGEGAVLVHSSGAALVEGSNARKLSVDIGEDGNMRVLSNINGEGGSDVTRYLSGGSLAGIKQARDGDLFEVAKRLDELVFDVATAVNEAHAGGVGLDGVGNRNIFDIAATSEGAARSIRLSADVAGNPRAIAAASDAGSLPGGSDNAVLLGGLANAPLGASGRTPGQRYADLVGDVASRKAAAARNAEMRSALHAQTQALRESVSGVSLEEEMVSLTKYQRAYDAAAKVLATVDEMFRQLLERIGR